MISDECATVACLSCGDDSQPAPLLVLRRQDAANHVLLYVNYAPGDWLRTLPCASEPFPDESVADSRFKVWGWENGHLCAFKDDQQQPIPLDRHYTRLAWKDAPHCALESAPTIKNSVPDTRGCLWGWQLERYRRGCITCCTSPLHPHPGDGIEQRDWHTHLNLA
jgi:hypothetical protein